MSEARYLVGDVFDRLAEIPDGSVDLIITSPPFFKLRSYLPSSHPDKHKEIGSESTPAMFVSTLLSLTREWRRVLAPHGSLCVELGDTYSGSSQTGGDFIDGSGQFSNPARLAKAAQANGARRSGPGWPLDKSLCLLPTLYPASLAYGRNLLTGEPCEPWRVRNHIVWHRPNPPVGALGDKVRPSTSYITVACTSRTRWFDLDAERTEPVGRAALRREGIVNKQYEYGEDAKQGPNRGAGSGLRRNTGAHENGAPPLDCWLDTTEPDVWTLPTQPHATPSGMLHVAEGGTDRLVRVQVGVAADGTQRTTSPNCPLHGSPDHQDSSASDDGRGEGGSTHNRHNGGRHVPSPLFEPPPTLGSTDPFESSDSQPGRAATPHSTTSSRTDRAPATNPADSASVETGARTGDTSTPPSSVEQHHDKPASSTSPDDSAVHSEPQSPPRIADTEPSELSCSCSYWIELPTQNTSNYATFPDVWTMPTQGFKGAHYATFPITLPRKLINLMCPRQVCVSCGEPRRRIVERTEDYAAARAAIGGFNQRANGQGTSGSRSVLSNAAGRDITCAENITIGWTDCGHDTWRRGIVLDPFVGSGTTLVAASEVGRDSIGIDLDERNLELARERCGMFLVENDEVVA